MTNDSKVHCPAIQIRRWREQDVTTVYAMLLESAIAQGGEHSLCADPQNLVQDGFCSNPQVYCLIAELRGEIVGILLYFFIYSTWTSRRGSYIEDLYVCPNHRREGIARALMSAAATLAMDAGCRYLQWVVLQRNDPARRFYESLGAFALSEWNLMRISGDWLQELSAESTLRT
jgi:GNAT superfamily N-acetyltransferase